MKIEDILNEELEALRSEIITFHERAGQVASGKTKDSFSIETQNFSGQLLGASYAGVLEQGRKPGAVPRYFLDIIKRWAIVKGISISDEKQFNRWANAVKWKIIKEGTKLYRSKQTLDIFTTPIANFESRLMDRTALYFKEETLNEIFNFK